MIPHPPTEVSVLTPSHLETLFCGKNYIKLVQGGILEALKGLRRDPLPRHAETKQNGPKGATSIVACFPSNLRLNPLFQYVYCTSSQCIDQMLPASHVALPS